MQDNGKTADTHYDYDQSSSYDCTTFTAYVSTPNSKASVVEYREVDLDPDGVREAMGELRPDIYTLSYSIQGDGTFVYFISTDGIPTLVTEGNGKISFDIALLCTAKPSLDGEELANALRFIHYIHQNHIWTRLNGDYRQADKCLSYLIKELLGINTADEAVTLLYNSHEYTEFGDYSSIEEEIVADIWENVFIKTYTVPSSYIAVKKGDVDSGVMEISLPEGIVSIEKEAFSGFANLKKINIPSTVKHIGESAFFGTAIESIIIPQGVTVIPKSAFSCCQNLSHVELSPDTVSIENNAFAVCTSLDKINLPEGLQYIGDNAFKKCESLTNVTIPEGCTVGSAFCECKSLISVKLSSLQTRIGANMFEGCSALCEIDIPASVESIRMYAFKDCTSLSKVTLHEGLNEICHDAFINCCKLNNISFPASLSIIGENAFYKSGITKAVLNESITKIGRYAFAFCKELTEVSILGTPVLDFCTFYGCSSLTRVTLNRGINKIPSDTFRDCEKLEFIDIPDPVESINSFVFNNCSSLTWIAFGNRVTEIAVSFKGCDALKSVFYRGTPEQFAKINYFHKDYTLDFAKIYYFSESEPLNKDNGIDYWHYDGNGYPEIY